MGRATAAEYYSLQWKAAPGTPARDPAFKLTTGLNRRCRCPPDRDRIAAAPCGISVSGLLADHVDRGTTKAAWNAREPAASSTRRPMRGAPTRSPREAATARGSVLRTDRATAGCMGAHALSCRIAASRPDLSGRPGSPSVDERADRLGQSTDELDCIPEPSRVLCSSAAFLEIVEIDLGGITRIGRSQRTVPQRLLYMPLRIVQVVVEPCRQGLSSRPW